MTPGERVTIQASYTADRCAALVRANGIFSDSTYDNVTNACDAMQQVMAYAYEDVTYDNSHPGLAPGLHLN